MSSSTDAAQKLLPLAEKLIAARAELDKAIKNGAALMTFTGQLCEQFMAIKQLIFVIGRTNNMNL